MAIPPPRPHIARKNELPRELGREDGRFAKCIAAVCHSIAIHTEPVNNQAGSMFVGIGGHLCCVVGDGWPSAYHGFGVDPIDDAGETTSDPGGGHWCWGRSSGSRVSVPVQHADGSRKQRIWCDPRPPRSEVCLSVEGKPQRAESRVQVPFK